MQLATDVGVQDTTSVNSEDARAQLSKEKRDSRKSVMGGHKSELLIAFTVLTAPMVALSAVLMALVLNIKSPIIVLPIHTRMRRPNYLGQPIL